MNTGNDSTSTLPQNRAGTSAETTDPFFLLAAADQLITAFHTIGTNLTKLRVAK